MHPLFKRILSLSLLIFAANAFAGTSNVNSFIGPFVRAGYTGLYDPSTSYSFLAEAGARNYRLNGTVGLKADEFQRFKVSAEFLRQSITFPFAAGNAEEWMNQGAVGADYQYNFLDNYLSPIVDINGYLSKAPSSTAGNATQTSPSFISDERRIAGSFASGFGTGVAVQPWRGGLAGVNFNYDDVAYDTENITGDKNAQGVGGGVLLKQSFNDMVDFGVQMDWRQPYDSYAATMDLFNLTTLGNTRVSLDYTYIRGKNSLPSTQNVGLGFIYMPDQNATTQKTARNIDFKDKPVKRNEPREDFQTWTSTPAVYMPQVLAIPDPAPITCIPPSFSGVIPPINTAPAPATPRNVAPFFTGSDLDYSISFTPDVGFTISISPTGVITYTPGGAFSPVVVTATNSCGTASSNAFLAEPGA